MAKKTNKTSHVLSLITNGDYPADPSGGEDKRMETPVSPPVPPQAAQAMGKKVTVVNGSENEKISNEILNRLTDELAKEGKKPPEDSWRMVNVMEQILGRQDLYKYMEQYGVCMCSRCRADVSALILTRLPSKYVVADNSCVTPLIGFYESKYKIRIITEIIKACMDVRERPRHDRGAAAIPKKE